MHNQDMESLCLREKAFNHFLITKTINMSVVTQFNYFHKPGPSLPLVSFLLRIKHGTYQRLVDGLRKYYHRDLDAEYDQQLRIMPRFSIAGNFTIKDDELQMVSYTRYFALEIPYLNEKDLMSVKGLLKKDDYVMACFRNALGIGLVMIVRTNTNRNQHRRVFKELITYYRSLTGVKRFAYHRDDIDHTVLVSIDEELYLNLDALDFPAAVVEPVPMKC